MARQQAVEPCGITRRATGPFGFEWVCVKPVHGTEKQRSSQRDPRGYIPQSERHHFVRRWPNGGNR